MEGSSRRPFGGKRTVGALENSVENSVLGPDEKSIFHFDDFSAARLMFIYIGFNPYPIS